MAGVKGRSGGARPGAGRKPAPVSVPSTAETPLAFLKAVMNDLKQDPKLRLRAAIAAAQYEHVKRADGGKKAEQAETASEAATGRFGARGTPLKLVSGA